MTPVALAADTLRERSLRAHCGLETSAKKCEKAVSSPCQVATPGSDFLGHVLLKRRILGLDDADPAPQCPDGGLHPIGHCQFVQHMLNMDPDRLDVE